jgi:hypothetical protein
MIRRIAAASVYTVVLLALLLTWPRWANPPHVDSATVITTTSVRWFVIFTPFLWGWVFYHFEDKRMRAVGLAGSVLLFVACFLFISYHDNMHSPCLWDSPGCGSDWFW